MDWVSLGFKENPFNTDPIRQSTIDLYTGHQNVIKVSQNVLSEQNVLMVIEGARGVGTTSFGNFLRFTAQEKKDYFTPTHEIRVGAGWTLETLLSVVIANVVREIDLFQAKKMTKDGRFQEAKALSMRIAETYRSFGVDAFGFGVSYGKSAGISSQPVTVPAAVLGHHLEDLAKLIKEFGYQYGLLLQLNNLDVGEIHEEKHLKYLFNELRDYIQTDYVSWLLIGDIGIRKFIAQHVDRLDDIVSYDASINPLSREEYLSLINRREKFYKTKENAELPIEESVFLYLYDLTKGRLRYVFGLLKRLLNELSVGDLTDRLTLGVVKPMVIKLAQERLTKHSLTKNEIEILKKLVELNDSNAAELGRHLAKTRQYITNAMHNLVEAKLVTVKKDGQNKIYFPILDAEIAFYKPQEILWENVFFIAKHQIKNSDKKEILAEWFLELFPTEIKTKIHSGKNQELSLNEKSCHIEHDAWPIEKLKNEIIISSLSKRKITEKIKNNIVILIYYQDEYFLLNGNTLIAEASHEKLNKIPVIIIRKKDK